MTYRRGVLAIIVLAAIAHAGLAALTGLGIDESYMVSHSRAFSLSYVDHSPLHVWIVGAWAKLWGSESASLLRLPFIALFAGSTWLMFRLTSRLFDERAGLWAVLAFNLSPVFGIAAATWILPEGPVDFFLLAGANVVAAIIMGGIAPRRAIAMWLAAGVLGGLAMLSKYHGVFLFVGTLAFLLTTPEARRHLASPGPWLGSAAAFAVFLPVMVWNLDHGMVGLRFQSDRLGNPEISVLRLAGSVAAQSVYLAIWTFIPAVIGLVRAFRAGPESKASWFLALLAIGPIAVFTLATLLAPGLPHWTATGWLFAMPLAGVVLAQWAAHWPDLMRKGAATAAALLVLLVAVIASQFFTGWMNRLMPESMARGDISRDIMDWRALRGELTRRGLLANGRAVAAGHWIQAGKASYALGPDVVVLCLSERPQHFAFRYRLEDYAGKDVVLVQLRQWHGRTDEALERRFNSIERLAPIDIHRANGAVAMTLDIAIGRGLRLP